MRRFHSELIAGAKKIKEVEGGQGGWKSTAEGNRGCANLRARLQKSSVIQTRQAGCL